MALCPGPQAGDRWQVLITKLEGRLPGCHGLGWRSHICPGLGRWSGGSSGFSDNNTNRCLGRGLGKSIIRNLGMRITHMLLLLSTTRGCRGSLVPTEGLLRLAGLASAGQETVNGKSMSRHHLFVKVGLCLWVGRFCCFSLDNLGGIDSLFTLENLWRNSMAAVYFGLDKEFDQCPLIPQWRWSWHGISLKKIWAPF